MSKSHIPFVAQDGFAYRHGALHVEELPLERIAAAVGTPFYCYSSAHLRHQVERFRAAFGKRKIAISYAVKANSNLAVIRTLAAAGCGADVVSEGELRRALAAGIPASRIVFSGVGKTPAEMALALDKGIFQINVESENELALLNAVAVSKGVRAPIGIRINPDVDARTHAKISTGKAENKFGIDLDRAHAVFHRAADLPGIEPLAIAVHIGSQVGDLSPFRAAFAKVADIVRTLRTEGLVLSRIDLGGGVGIAYRGEAAPDLGQYARIVLDTVGPLETELTFEPGRLLVGNAGMLVAKVLYLKAGATRRFVIIDAAMNDLIRPSLYEAYHGIVPLRAPASDAILEPADVVGPVCESGDTFAVERPLPPLAEGDLVALQSAGAYGAVMSSTYNSRLLVPEVLVEGGDFAVIRPRPSFEELLALDHMPPWLAQTAPDAT
jgi:diaminopimelate decarboxylase